jgi:N utilization substance protein A
MAAIRGLSAARDLPPEVIVDALKEALAHAFRKMPDGTATNVTVDLDERTGESRVFAHYTVVEERYIEDPEGEISLERARGFNPDAQIGDTITQDVTPEDFGRIAAQTAKQVIMQRIREAEREQTYTTYADREGEIVYGTIQTANRDAVTVALDRVEALLPKSGQIPGERYTPNQRLRVYVSEVKRSPKGPQVIVSRTHREMLKRLMELEIPEVFQGVVEIKGIAREAGSRSKVAVWAHHEGVDPVGACVGMRGVRIQALVRELGGEKIDIVHWDPDPRIYIANALSPAKVVHVWLEEDAERRTANVIVLDNQLSLAIGREGQNARLAAKLTGWRIDIRAESEAGEVMDSVRAEEASRVAERARQAALAAEAEAAAAAAIAGTEAAVEDEEEEMPLEPAAQATVDLVSEAEPAEAVPVEVVAPEEPESVAEAEAPAAATVAVEAPEVALVPVAPGAAPTGDAEEDEEGDEELGAFGAAGRRRKRRLVRDPKTGALIAETRRKGSRQRPEWEEDVGRWTDDDLKDAMGFTEDDFLARVSEDDDEEDDA